MTIVELLDRARARGGFRSDGQLGRALGLTDSVVCQYRSGKTAPSDAVALQLAEIAGVDAAAAVLLAASLRAKDDHLRRLYREIGRKISGIAILVFAVLFALPSDGHTAGTNQPVACINLYIMRSLLRHLRSACGRLRRWAAAPWTAPDNPGTDPSAGPESAGAAARSLVYRRQAEIAWLYWRPSVLR